MALAGSLSLLAAVATIPADTTRDSTKAADSAAAAAAVAKFEASLTWREGAVSVKDGLATFALPAGYRYLDPEDASRVLEAWGNPPGAKTLGMLFPPNVGPFSDASWAVIVSYDEDGYVEDDEAAKIDYDELLRDMRKSVVENNEERAKEGFEPITLVGWAAPPRYDSTAHKLYWAKELKFGSNESNTLNYSIRALGRRGVLVLNAVAGMSELAQVEAGMKDVLGFVSFNEGHRYTDFIPGKDKVAAYGVGALIVGSAAAKAGLFKGLIAALFAAKKLIIVAVVAVGAGLVKLFAKKKEESSSSNA